MKSEPEESRRRRRGLRGRDFFASEALRGDGSTMGVPGHRS
jgi:hypothetical protein